MKILDALAMGMPIVSTTFAASGLALRNGEHLLIADTAEAFVEQIVRLLADKGLREHLAQGGVDVVSHAYSWDTIGRSLVAAYEEAAATKNQGMLING